MKVAIVTPTIGSEHLAQCLESVQNQTYENLTHYVFVDGEDYHDAVSSAISEKTNGRKPIKTISFQENVGKGWYGHRVYAACSFLVNADVICYLDEDNWYEPNHVESIVESLNKHNVGWVYSLRNIYDKEGEFLCEDNCESLGKWPVYFNDKIFHVDTSTFGVRRDVALRIGHAWYGQWGADRQFFGALKQFFPDFECTTKHSVNYRLDGNPNSVNYDFFKSGNEAMQKKYSGPFPWHEDKLKVEVAPGIKILM